MERRETLPIPRGWFAVAHSDELAPGEVSKVHYFGEDLVVFRTESGAAGVFEAFCPHLGAHLGVGGKVDGESLRCPFHGWALARPECTDIPYAKRIPPGVRAGSLETLERNGFIRLVDPDGSEPWYDVPEVPEAASGEWSTPDRMNGRSRPRSRNSPRTASIRPTFSLFMGRWPCPSPRRAKRVPPAACSRRSR